MKKDQEKTSNGEVAVIDFNNAMVVSEEQQLPAPMEAVDLNGNLPDLSDAQESPVDLVGNYWTPTQIGECKRVYYDCIKTRMVPVESTGEAIELPCAYFLERIGNDIKTISNGSKRLVGIFENGSIERGTPIQITYLGKKKGSKYFYDDWAVKLLLKQA